MPCPTSINQRCRIWQAFSIASIEQAVDAAVAEIAAAERIALYGVGREGLQIKGLAMRLYSSGTEGSDGRGYDDTTFGSVAIC